ncbi:MAG: NAD(P)/FAD-dependent oxidoreductase [Methanospirillaceae archaeon]|nr:NAD(P)/FAD-dependent oxidoreductase [Methanospirillaceae archaeon]
MDLRTNYDVIVIGAGPVGCAAAQACAEGGLSTLLIEEHGTIGYPVQCAGLLSVRAFKECRVGPDSVLHTVCGAHIISGDKKLSFQTEETRAYVVDRMLLDQEMGQKAVAAGCDILIKSYARLISSTMVYCSGAMGSHSFRAKIIIAADGPKSAIARSKGLSRPRAILSGLQCDIRHDMDPSCVEIYPNSSDDFFGWIIPTGSGRARAGLAGLSDVAKRFQTFMKPYQQSCSHFVAGAIPIGVIEKTYADHTLITGDAAGFAKPTSGGGVYTGVRSARHAADTALWACEQDRFDALTLSRYEKSWKHDFGRELDLGYHLFTLRKHVRKEDINYFLKYAQNASFIHLIEEQGDMDRPSQLLKKMIFSPVIARTVASSIAGRFHHRIS